MKFTYFRKTGEIYRDVGGEYEWDGDEGYDFEYEVDYHQVQSALADLIYDDYFDGTTTDRETVHKIKNKLERFISDMELVERLSESYHDGLKNYFEEEAQESENGD